MRLEWDVSRRNACHLLKLGVVTVSGKSVRLLTELSVTAPGDSARNERVAQLQRVVHGAVRIR